MMCDRDDLETERQHFGYKARLDDLGRINALFLEMRKAFLKEAADGAENLQVVCDGCVVERKGHGVGFPSLCVLIACDNVPGNCPLVDEIVPVLKVFREWRRSPFNVLRRDQL